jgi:glycosyltransferase involved in cell wall biosynthesis
MTEKFGYIPKDERKKVLLLCDDIRMHSGIATMAREFVLGTAHHFNWYNVGAAINHPEVGKILDLSDDVNKQRGLEDASVKVMPNNGYGDAMLIRQLLKKEKFDAIFIFTDPRYWTWLFEMEREIRSQVPIFWLNIWDDYPAPKYNEHYYDSVDVLMAISKQTKNINEIVLGDKAKSKIIKYVPHGIDHKIFKPILETDPQFEQFLEFKKNIFNGKDIEFVVFFNSRNIHRKRPGDVILSYRQFCDRIGKEAAKKCALVMHTAPKDDNGTDLRAVKDAFCDPEYVNVFFSQDRLSSPQMNLLYNLADVSVLISSNEGWGLSLTESMMAGTMIIGNVTGGMQDQMRFEDGEGKWIDFTPDFPSNHRGTIKQCGEWAVPVFPSNISLAGSPSTPYIFDDRCAPEDVAAAIEEVYNMSPEERKDRGLKGREWATSDEAQMSADTMSKNIQETMDEGFENFTPRPAFEIHKAETRPSKYIDHKLIGY